MTSVLTSERSGYAGVMANYMDASSVAELLRSAAAAVETAALPAELQEAGFRAAVKLLAGPPSSSHGSSASEVPQRIQQHALAKDAPTESPSGSLASVASTLRIPEDRVRLLFDDVNGGLQFCGDIGELGDNRAAKVKNIALLLLAARQGGGYDAERTDDAPIRAEIQRLRIYDRSNYVKQIRAAFKGNAAITGSSRNLSYRIHDTGIQAAVDLTVEILAD